jgi:uncharacterized protein DUF6353
MNLSDLAKKLSKFTVDNSPAILTAIGVAGTLTTAYLTGRASFKVAPILERESSENPLEPKEVFYLTWKAYLPAAGSAVATIVCIILAQRIGMRRTAALAAAYAISEKAWDEYKDKVIEKIGENKEREVRDELAKDKITGSPVSEMIIIGAGSVLCFETFTGRYFLSDMETLRKAQNDLNYKVQNDYYASLTDFYNLIELPRTDYSDEVGWNSDKLLELEFSTQLTEDGRPCLAISFKVTPIRDYYRVN